MRRILSLELDFVAAGGLSHFYPGASSDIALCGTIESELRTVAQQSPGLAELEG